MIIYKIRNKNDISKFVQGTPAYYAYNKTGRIFQTLGQLRSFLTTCMRYNQSFSEWEIIEFRLAEHAIKGVHEVIKPEKMIELLKQ